jgi:hypothetical protein
MAVGFEFSETMSGSYHTLDRPADELPMSITVRAAVHDVKKFLLDPTAEISGEVDAEGLADHKALRGTLEINPLLRRRLVYDFRFADNDGADCRFHGEKEIEASRLVSTMTTLPGTIFRDDKEVGRAILRFHMRADLLKMIRSFRPR